VLASRPLVRNILRTAVLIVISVANIWLITSSLGS
jgi:hypothetical protein